MTGSAPRVWTPEEVVERWLPQTTPGGLRKRAQRGAIPYTRVAGRIGFTEADVAAIVERGRRRTDRTGRAGADSGLPSRPRRDRGGAAAEIVRPGGGVVPLRARPHAARPPRGRATDQSTHSKAPSGAQPRGPGTEDEVCS